MTFQSLPDYIFIQYHSIMELGTSENLIPTISSPWLFALGGITLVVEPSPTFQYRSLAAVIQSFAFQSITFVFSNSAVEKRLKEVPAIHPMCA
jgi:hypothetical protein